MSDAANLFDAIPALGEEEQFLTLLARPGLKIERIVSTGQSSPPGFWYDQAWDEWVLLVAGHAVLEFDGGRSPYELHPGAHVHIPAGRRHRVAWTDPGQPTIWLAVHSGDIPHDDLAPASPIVV